MKKVYIILSCTGTVPSQLIQLATNAPFTHASISMLPDRTKLYSYARRRKNNFLVAGYIHEDIDSFVFAKYPFAPCAVYEIEVSDEGYHKMLKKLAFFDERYKKCKYSFVGAVTSQFRIRKHLKYRYTCAQFVASILDSSGEVKLPKHPSLIKPMDLTRIPYSRLIYNGPLKDIHFKDHHI